MNFDYTMLAFTDLDIKHPRIPDPEMDIRENCGFRCSEIYRGDSNIADVAEEAEFMFNNFFHSIKDAFTIEPCEDLVVVKIKAAALRKQLEHDFEEWKTTVSKASLKDYAWRMHGINKAGRDFLGDEFSDQAIIEEEGRFYTIEPFVQFVGDRFDEDIKDDIELHGVAVYKFSV